MPSIQSRAVRIGGCEGGITDHHGVLARMAQNEDVDVIFGDWMSEYNMTTRGVEKVQDPTAPGYEAVFLQSLEPALEHLAAKKIKLAANAGASGTELLTKHVREIIARKGLDLKVAWVSGDEIPIEDLKNLHTKGDKLQRLTTDKDFSTWEFDPIYAQCYLGGRGIAKAWAEGADIVLTGRVSDPAPVIAAGIWWHGWNEDQLDELAGALVCGHLIECGAYVCGANWSGFKSLGTGKNIINLGYPIAELAKDGTCIISKEQGSKGVVSTETCRSQLLYEIQGPWYFNSDVVADLTNISMEQLGPDRVKVSGAKGLPPPPTTKVGITAIGGYQAETHFYVVGLDVEEKAAMFETQIRDVLPLDKYHCFRVSLNGRPPNNPRSQESATCDLRVFAQARNVDDLQTSVFLQPVVDTVMQTYPGAQFSLDMRQGTPKLYYEFWVALIPQGVVSHRLHFSDKTFDIPVPTKTQTYPRHQPSYDPENPLPLTSWGLTTMAPMGYIVHARSGDKSSNCNVGFYVRFADEWDWLRSTLTIAKVKELLGDDYKGGLVERFELPNLWAVHFLLLDHLDRGVASSSTYDILGKNVAEYLRAKHVEIPTRFLERGKI
ncbi:uncharacterized protein Z520_08631 [Fonsecaea multimorphosa CBS 102226]|uniref:DUF1446-domain-containing protein n=1 Tax=Fonsecaea multimorphosa CBS 102226 TaxID=1442371 RepID=A0A0D2IEK4_9EURO|nr:uncharacterized protein Z520_08631 [Fonsecaea multimorphosa CBS 102226]KIX95511.1 hypothetical protein Z520_08631 [Fonsecaea multimorphosa CBS 102226]OAL21357.1 hypothetical protein AYO22_08080 [Fonsecaea multimorphosa]